MKQILSILFILVVINSFGQKIEDYYLYPFPRVENNLHAVFVTSTMNCSEHPDSINYNYFDDNVYDTLEINAYYTGSSWPGGTTVFDSLDISNYFNSQYLYLEYKIFIKSEFYISDSVMYKLDSISQNIMLFNNIKVDEVSNSNRIKIFPNPTTKTINITSDKIIKTVSITDINGKIVKQLDINARQCIIDLSSETKAVYFLKLMGEGFVSAQKVILE
jgi:hypothetical protein